MFEIQGEYNKASVFAQTIDQTTHAQILSMLNNPAFQGSKISIQADCHAGAGSVIGFTATQNDYVIPNVVGVDIGCGVTAVWLGKREFDLDAFDHNIKRTVPSGFNGHHDKEHLNLLTKESRESLHDIHNNIKCDISLKEFYEKVGSLGGGNHFIELDKDENGDIWLVIHSGSRNFGLQVAGFYQKKAAELHPGFKSQEYMSIAEGGQDYLNDMRKAQAYAMINRDAMVRQIFNHILREDFKEANYRKIESVHNYIGDDHIIRKGAISAYKDENVVIPMNMAFGTVVGIGKGSEAHNFSAPHGAGRVMGRGQAKKTLNMDEFKKSMEGIHTSTATQRTLDEAPMAYKNPQEILDQLAETVEVKSFLKPIYNFKSEG